MVATAFRPIQQVTDSSLMTLFSNTSLYKPTAFKDNLYKVRIPAYKTAVRDDVMGRNLITSSQTPIVLIDEKDRKQLISFEQLFKMFCLPKGEPINKDVVFAKFQNTMAMGKTELRPTTSQMKVRYNELSCKAALMAVFVPKRYSFTVDGILVNNPAIQSHGQGDYIVRGEYGIPYKVVPGVCFSVCYDNRNFGLDANRKFEKAVEQVFSSNDRYGY